MYNSDLFLRLKTIVHQVSYYLLNNFMNINAYINNPNFH